ncbi:MAG TPA: beta-ketoacyl-[acyl-carrier-protein] synthase family protein [Bacteroidales bacterium]|nr:beta-ketoacyl-[acyl-carrier-protein] synthase family protein [Bacteroidales bacterium]
MNHRVFVTGLGIISAIGNGTEETLKSLFALKSGIGPLSLFESVHHNIPVAQIRYSDSELALLAALNNSKKDYTRNSLLSLIASKQALASSGWKDAEEKRTGAVFATTVGGMDYNEKYYKSLLSSSEYKDYIRLFDSSDSSEKVASYHGIRRHITTISTACSSSANAILTGSRMIKNGLVDRVLAGGNDSLTRFTLNGFFALEILSPTGCRPFDMNRNGLTIGEGAAFLVLESEKTADPAKVICEVTGYANVNEAFHATASSEEGLGAAMAMSQALASAGLQPSEISYINAHGTGTEINDLSEGTAIGRVFSGAIPPVSSTKGFTGHTLGAAGAVEAVFSALAIQNNLLLPALNFSQRMPELDFEPQIKTETAVVKNVMSNSFGFGGSNTTLIFSKV